LIDDTSGTLGVESAVQSTNEGIVEGSRETNSIRVDIEDSADTGEGVSQSAEADGSNIGHSPGTSSVELGDQILVEGHNGVEDQLEALVEEDGEAGGSTEVVSRVGVETETDVTRGTSTSAFSDKGVAGGGEDGRTGGKAPAEVEITVDHANSVTSNTDMSQVNGDGVSVEGVS